MGSSNTTSRAAPSISARAICTSLRSVSSVAHQPFGVDRQLPVLLENCAVAASSVGDPAPPSGCDTPAQKHRFRDGKVRDQVQPPVDNADAGGFDGCRIAEVQRVTVEVALPLSA